MAHMIDTQVAIIGGGIVGATIAHALSKYKVNVCVLEKQPMTGHGLTKCSQGGLHGGTGLYMSKYVKWWEGGGDLKSYLAREDHLKDRLNDPGVRMFYELQPFLKAKILTSGRVMVAEAQDDIEKMKIFKELAEEKGWKGISILDRDGIREKEPLLDPRFIGGLYDPHTASVNATEWTTAFTEVAAQNGVHILLNTEVHGIEQKTGGYIIKTNDGSLRAEYVVNAAGIFSDEIARMVGGIDFSFTIWKCQMLVMENTAGIQHTIVTMPKPMKSRMLYMTTDGNILASHTMDLSNSKSDHSTTREGLDLLSTYLNYYLPEAEFKILRSFAGIMHFNTRNPDDYLIERPKPKFISIIACPPAVTPAPALALDIVKMLADEGLGLVEKSDFNPYRDVEPRFIELATEEKNRKIEANPGYGHLVCRCEKVSEEEIRQAVRAGATTVDDVKFRTRATMGRCQGGFCTSRILKIMADEMGVSPLELTLKGGNSYVLACETKGLIRGDMHVGQRS
ncbi:MAG: FAD-dependent oxidoreductase [Dehalococcoidia bacterium]|nr:FAD-dependent oxidoreductase [Dehalococcoidia bacterium]